MAKLGRRGATIVFNARRQEMLDETIQEYKTLDSIVEKISLIYLGF